MSKEIRHFVESGLTELDLIRGGGPLWCDFLRVWDRTIAPSTPPCSPWEIRIRSGVMHTVLGGSQGVVAAAGDIISDIWQHGF